jgi:hypothetical protein
MSNKKVNPYLKKGTIIELVIIFSIIVTIFIAQIFTSKGLADVGIPFVFIGHRLTGNLPDPFMGELYTRVIVWQNLGIDFVLYFLIVWPVVHYSGKILKKFLSV